MADQHALVREYLRRYYAALAAYEAAQDKHAAAKAALAATGAVVNRDEFQQAAAERIRIVLPTEKPLAEASRLVSVAWNGFQETLRRSGLVLRDLANALGIRE